MTDARRTRRDAPIGVFDSGVGGLTVLKELRRQLPNESTVYLGDEARMPYGPRPHAEVVEFTREAVAWLSGREVKLIVLACNTASSVALEAVRDETSVPVLGVVRPGAAAALSASPRRRIGVLATAGTVTSGAYVRALKDIDPFVEVHQQACPKLVPLVESGEFASDAAREAVAEYVGWMTRPQGGGHSLVDTVLLGCTHYPLLRPIISEFVGPETRVVDSATTTAFAVREILGLNAMLAEKGPSTHRVFTTSDTATFRRVARTLFGEDLPAVEEVGLSSPRARR